MRQTVRRTIVLGGMLSLMALPLGLGCSVSANNFTSPNFSIDTSVIGGSLSGPQSSTNYRMTSSGGESVIGQGTSGSYKLGEGYIPTLESSLQLTVQPNGLSMYYPFDENVGTAVWDASANTNHATTTGTPTWTTGKAGNAMTLNGSSQAIVGQDVDIPTAITVAIWVNPTTSSQNAIIVSKHSSGTDAQALLQLISGSATFGVTTSGSGTLTNSGSAAMGTGTWHHLVGTYDGTDVKLYVDGSLVDTDPATGTIATNAFAWTIGKEASASSAYFNGSVDEFKVLDRALSAEEVKAEYDAQNAGLPAGLSFASGITPGISKTSSFDTVTLTDAPGYILAINQNNDLTNGGNTIAAVSGSIASPVSWSEGTTKGLGFTLYGTNATAIAGTWNSGASYAALPGSGTTFYTRTGLSGGTKDYLNMRLRLDVPASQAALTYTNQMTITGTITP